MPILLAGHLDAAERSDWLRCLSEALPDDVFVTDLTATEPDGIDVAIVANPPAGALQGLPKLRLIQSLWAGVDKLMRDSTIPAQVPLARMVDPAMNDAMAQTALWAVLSLHRGFFVYARQQREIEWTQHVQRRADEVNVAVLGLGEMGRAVAATLCANRYRVFGWSRNPSALPGVQTHHGAAALDTVIAQADIVINLLPLTDETRGIFDARRFAQMRRGAALVNLGRGAHVVDADLLAALAAGQIGHAVLDVFHTEPLVPEHAFWRHPRVTVLPHAAALTDARSASRVVADNVRAIRSGASPRYLVDRSRGY